jgi:nucleotide-binding universal stress UspA family protein
MLFKNILVPYDGSRCSNHAFKVALDIAKKYNSKITTLSCLDSELGLTWYGFDYRVKNAILKKQKKSIEKDITKFTDLIKKTKIPFSSKIIETNSVAKSIVSFSKSNKIDLIVMGSHGRRGFDKILLGSVANGVSQQAKCPVLILK